MAKIIKKNKICNIILILLIICHLYKMYYSGRTSVRITELYDLFQGRPNGRSRSTGRSQTILKSIVLEFIFRLLTRKLIMVVRFCMEVDPQRSSIMLVDRGQKKFGHP